MFPIIHMEPVVKAIMNAMHHEVIFLLAFILAVLLYKCHQLSDY